MWLILIEQVTFKKYNLLISVSEVEIMEYMHVQWNISAQLPVSGGRLHQNINQEIVEVHRQVRSTYA